MGKIARGSWQKKMFEKMSSPRGLYSSEILEELPIKCWSYERKSVQSLDNMIERAKKEGLVHKLVYPVYFIKTKNYYYYDVIHYIRPKNAPDMKYIRMASISARKGFFEEAVRMIALIEKEDFEAADEFAKEIESKIILDAI